MHSYNKLRGLYVLYDKLANSHEHLKLLTPVSLSFILYSELSSWLLRFDSRIINLKLFILSRITNKLFVQYSLTRVVITMITFFVVLKCRKQYGQCFFD